MYYFFASASWEESKKVWILKFSNAETLEDKDTNIHLQKHKIKPVCYQMTENPSPHPCPHPSLRYFPQSDCYIFPFIWLYKNNQEMCAKKKKFSCLSSANSPSIFTTLCSHTQIQMLMWSLYSAFSFPLLEGLLDPFKNQQGNGWVTTWTAKY